MISWRSVTPRFFETLRVPIVHGRAFQDSDQQPSQQGMIINETLARKMFPGEEPLGRRVAPGRGMLQWFTVVGVVKDTRDTTGQVVEPEYFLARVGGITPGRRTAYLMVRTVVNPVAAVSLLREMIRTLDPRLPVTIQRLSQRVAALTDRPRFIAWLLVAFAVLALLLAASGLYGVASYLVAQRNRDIGIRIALGARQAQVCRQVIQEASRWIVAGAALGCALAWTGARTLDSQLQGVSARDPWSWGISIVTLALVLLLAVVRPAARAARVDPMKALRAE
jgi:predicted lysophospholipase L1 biosynthesis ABC-type transport system permease subunit